MYIIIYIYINACTHIHGYVYMHVNVYARSYMYEIAPHLYACMYIHVLSLVNE